MSLFKKIKNYFKRKRSIKKLQKIVTKAQIEAFFCKDNQKNNTIVFVTTSLLEFDKDAGASRFYELIKAYISLNYRTVICSENVAYTNPYLLKYQDLGAVVFFDNSISDNPQHFLKNYIIDANLIWYYGPNSFNKYHNKIKKILPKSKIIFDMIDIHHLRIKRAMQLEPTRLSQIKRYKKYFEIETKTAKNADWIVTISDIEKDYMSKYHAEQKMVTISTIHCIKIALEKCATFENRKDILFIGSGHSPNVDAIYFLKNEIMPLVWQQLPDLKVHVIGSVKDHIKDVVHDNLIFHGFVSDVESFFTTSKFMIAPLRYGAGVKGKIGQAFEYFLPVITTDIGVEGMNLLHETNTLIANNAEDFASEIIRLYNDKTLWKKLQNNSELSLQPFSIDLLYKTLEKIN